MFSYNPDYNTDNEIAPTEYNPERDIEPIEMRDDNTSYISGERAVSMLVNGFTVYKHPPDAQTVITIKPDDLDIIENTSAVFDVPEHTFYASASDVQLQIAVEEISLMTDDLTEHLRFDVPEHIFSEFVEDQCENEDISYHTFNWNDGLNVYQNVSKILLCDVHNCLHIREAISNYLSYLYDNYEDCYYRNNNLIYALKSKLDSFSEQYCADNLIVYLNFGDDAKDERDSLKERLLKSEFQHFYIDEDTIVIFESDVDYIRPILENEYGLEYDFEYIMTDDLNENIFNKAEELIKTEIENHPDGYNIVLPDELLKNSKDLAFYVQSYKAILKEPDDYLPEIRRDTFENFSSDVYAFGNKDVQHYIDDAFKIAFYDALSDNDKSIIDYYLENNNLNLSLAFIEEGFKGVNFNIFNDEARKQFSNMIIDLRNPKSKKEIKERD